MYKLYLNINWLNKYLAKINIIKLTWCKYSQKKRLLIIFYLDVYGKVFLKEKFAN